MVNDVSQILIPEGAAYIPNEYGSSVLLPHIQRELQLLKNLLTNNGQTFPGSTTPVDHRQRYRWMEYFGLQQLPICMIVWPGTHNSATYRIDVPLVSEAFVKCQSASIYEQLRLGVRCLDIRIQQDRMICQADVVASYGIDTIIEDIKRFINETNKDIILLEIRTEYGQTDPPDFERYLIDQLGDLLVHQNDQVFSRTIAQVLPRRIICVWKPRNSASPAPGSPLWSGGYLKDDWINTDKPLTKFNGNKDNLRNQVQQVSERKYFYRIEHTLTAQTDSPVEFLIFWNKHVETLSRRLYPFARLFLAKCHNESILDKLQIFSSDFVDHDFIDACIQLNRDRNLKRITTNVSASNSFMLSAYDLIIAWGSDTNYWKWSPWSNERYDVAELLKVCWLDVNGKFDTARLSAGTTYEVIYVIILKGSSYGMDDINLRLILPNGDKKERTENLDNKPRDIRLEILVGSFTASRNMAGEMKFSLDERENMNWKSGLIVIGVFIKAT